MIGFDLFLISFKLVVLLIDRKDFEVVVIFKDVFSLFLISKYMSCMFE